MSVKEKITKMKNTLKELWYGNILLNSEKPSEEYRALLREYCAYSDKIDPTLTKESAEMLEKQREIATHMASVLESDAFSCGFSLGARMMIDVFLQEL